jgi:hypothetical protein
MILRTRRLTAPSGRDYIGGPHMGCFIRRSLRAWPADSWRKTGVSEEKDRHR